MNSYVLENALLKLTLSDWGASWLSCQVKLPHGWREVLVTTTPDRWAQQSAYFGATIGRYANRIAHGRYQLNGKRYQLAQNNGRHNLHGGEQGADKRRWTVEFAHAHAVRFSYVFANGEEGFGGEVQAAVEYRLNGDQLEIVFEGISDQDTPFCLTNHAYFNLSGDSTIHQHQLQLNADTYLPVDETGIPNAPLTAVAGTGFDFRHAKPIGQDLLKDADQQAVKGYDHAFLLVAKTPEKLTACPPDAVLSVADLRLELRTTQPALQLYTGNWLQGQPNLHGGCFADYAGVALEPEALPDSPNHPEWWHWGGILTAGKPSQQRICYRFCVNG